MQDSPKGREMDFTLVVSHAQGTLKLYLSTDRLQNLLRKRCQYIVSFVNPPQSQSKASVLEHHPDKWSSLQDLNVAHVTQNFDLSNVSAAMLEMRKRATRMGHKVGYKRRSAIFRLLGFLQLSTEAEQFNDTEFGPKKANSFLTKKHNAHAISFLARGAKKIEMSGSYANSLLRSVLHLSAQSQSKLMFLA
ncbi:hypothetical protein C9975_02800 [Thalassospira xiamenensis]|jgi:hypothetical protein|nr:hypothetical protein C9975_02800 [Thalassospira xiamenensis]